MMKMGFRRKAVRKGDGFGNKTGLESDIPLHLLGGVTSEAVFALKPGHLLSAW